MSLIPLVQISRATSRRGLVDINDFEQAEAGCEIAQHISKSMKINEEHDVLSGDEQSGLERIHTRLTNICSQKNERMAAMTDQEPEKLFELLDQREERDKQRWYIKERSAYEPEPPTLFRAVKDYPAVENHLTGKLWFQSLPSLRNSEGIGKDASEGIGSYALPDGRTCRDVNDDNPTAFILSFGEQAESVKKFGEYCLEVRNPLELKRRVEDRLCPGSQVEWRKIQYDKVMNKDNKVMQLETNPGPTESWDLMYYSKPKTFAQEKEWRLLIFLPMRLLNATLELQVGNLPDVFRLIDLRGQEKRKRNYNL